MPEDQSVVHISSAVVQARPEHIDHVAAFINSLDGCEVAHVADTRLVAILEGPSSGFVGDMLSRIALCDGVLSANMVYEQIETAEALGEDL